MKKLFPSRYLILALLVSMGLSLLVCVGLGFAFFPFWTKGLVRSTHALADILDAKPGDDGREHFDRIVRFRNRLNYNRIGVWLVGTTEENPTPHVLTGTDVPPANTEPLASLPQEKEAVALYNPHSFRAFHALMRLPTDRPRWLWFSSDVGEGTFGIGRALVFSLFLVISTTASLAAYMLLRFIFLNRAKRAQQVITEFSRGNLQARLPYDSPESSGLSHSFNKMAGDIERMVGQLKTHELLRQTLVAELSHDLRTPLTAIRIALDSKEVESGHDATKTQQLMNIARGELSYIQRLLEYLFTAAKSDVPLIPVRMEKVELASLIAAEIERLKTISAPNGEKEVNWVLEVRCAQTEVKADRAMTTRLFRNILENARRYAEKNVKVELLSEEGELLVSVFNDGPPIDLEKYESARFAKLGSVSAENAAHSDTSLGLGSQIISAIVALHDWEISVESRPNGTEVMLRIL